jgi:hypothetical protein
MNLDMLAEASRGLWLATLALMTAFMHATGVEHRRRLARRIAGNLRMLEDQPCFREEDRARFGRLAARWHAKAEPVENTAARGAGWNVIQRLFAR